MEEEVVAVSHSSVDFNKNLLDTWLLGDTSQIQTETKTIH